ncbi:hypothetical protein C8J56DRAFT_826342 [Mycena floridula]|nr:hypothetical protein C8J56DRAFT_826342 [Mycena floridula]
MSEKCKVCDFSDASEPGFPADPAYAPLPHLLPFIGTNNPPSQSQESRFKEMLAESVGSLKDLNDRIQAMRHDLEELVRQRARKEREVEEYKLVLHPIRRLPEEILCEIFLTFVNEDLEEDLDDTTLDASSTIWILPQVSAHWRSIAVSFARMWSTVRLLAEDFDIDRLPKTIRMLGAQLYRSASHQLSISIFSDVDIPRSHLLLEMLFSTSSRWKELSIYVTTKSLESFSPLRGSLPLIATLHVWAYDRRIVPATLNMFEFAPKLTKLIGHPHVLCKLIFPSSQTVQCGQEIRSTCVSHIALLSRTPNLQRITIACIKNDGLDSTTDIDLDQIPRSITLPFVTRAAFRRELNVDEEREHLHSSNGCALILRLTLPALKDPDIHVYHSMDELQHLLRRSQCPLETLSLYIYGVPDDACIALLKDIPTLTSFTLKCSDDLADKFMEPFSKSPTIVPSLQFLKLENSCSFDSVQIEQLKASRPSLSVVETDGVRF